MFEVDEATTEGKVKRFLILVAALTMTLTMALPAAAITDGEPAGDAHPEVVLIIMDVGGEPTWRCSGTLISPTMVLTAGHCASNFPGDPATGFRVFTESDVDNGDNDYPYGTGNNTVEAIRWAAHPEYENAPFFFNDVAMLVSKLSTTACASFLVSRTFATSSIRSAFFI